jgi:hypothetical protein
MIVATPGRASSPSVVISLNICNCSDWLDRATVSIGCALYFCGIWQSFKAGSDWSSFTCPLATYTKLLGANTFSFNNTPSHRYLSYPPCPQWTVDTKAVRSHGALTGLRGLTQNLRMWPDYLQETHHCQSQPPRPTQPARNKLICFSFFLMPSSSIHLPRNHKKMASILTYLHKRPISPWTTPPSWPPKTLPCTRWLIPG